MDNGKYSTIAISIIVLFLGFIIADPSILKDLIGNEAIYARIGPLVLAFITVVYNYANPRKQDDGAA